MSPSPDRTHYDVLGIARDADAAAVRSAWKLHVQAWHPDRFSGEMREHAEAQTARINEAYTTLRDGSRRAAYDCRLAADEADAARDARPPRRAAERRSAMPQRHAATPVGTPMAVASQPQTLGEQVAEATREAGELLRRHPKATAAVLVAMLMLCAAGVAMQVFAGPSVPTSGTTIDHEPARAITEARTEQDSELARLAEQARIESQRADEAMQEMLAQDEAAEQAPPAEQADPRTGAAPRAGSAAAPRSLPRVPSGRVVRVMPNAL